MTNVERSPSNHSFHVDPETSLAFVSGVLDPNSESRNMTKTFDHRCSGPGGRLDSGRFGLPGVSGFERLDLPLSLLLQAAHRQRPGAFGRGEKPVHSLRGEPRAETGSGA